MIKNLLLDSSVQQSNTVIHIQVSILLPFRLLKNIEQSSLCYTVGPCWLSILNIAGCFPGGAGGKEPTSQCRRCKRLGFDYWVRRSPGGGHGNSLQYSCLENPIDRGAWRAPVHGVAKSWTRLSDFTFTFT